MAIAFVFPIVLTVTNSFMSESEISRNYAVISGDAMRSGVSGSGSDFLKLKFIPDEVVIKQYLTVLLRYTKFLSMFWNSVIIVIPIIFGQIAVASMAAYAFGKIEFKWRDKLFLVYIVTMLMPFQVTLVPNYIIADKLGLIGNFLSIIFPGIFSTFGVFLLRQFMIYIPKEYNEAVTVDGGSHIDAFLKVILPMSKTGLAALAILVFIDNWNMVEQPIIFLQDFNRQPLSIYLSVINANDRGISFAASTIYMLPMLLVFMYGENYFVEGIQLSGIKG
ncbi:MAG TPA: carbohydrate ABC transporter permease [Clostridia bacterium]|nr:carbohydrate ABC transporter permease [Clostridia bacterium]